MYIYIYFFFSFFSGERPKFRIQCTVESLKKGLSNAYTETSGRGLQLLVLTLEYKLESCLCDISIVL